MTRNREQEAAYREKNRLKLRAYQTRWSRQFRYGFTRDQMLRYEGLLGAVCDLCGGPFDNTRANAPGPQFDHDHSTGQFRGWLCHGCNIGLGGFKDRPDMLRRAADYLEAPRLEFE